MIRWHALMRWQNGPMATNCNLKDTSSIPKKRRKSTKPKPYKSLSPESFDYSILNHIPYECEGYLSTAIYIPCPFSDPEWCSLNFLVCINLLWSHVYESSLLLTRSKKEADPPLTWILSDPIRRDFFWPKGKKTEKFDVFRGNFPNSNPNHKWLTRLKPQKTDLTQPWSKIFDPDPSLAYRFHLIVTNICPK